MSRVLVTGSSGLVGSAIAQELLREGYEVVGLGRRLTRANRGLTAAVSADLSRPGALVAALEGPRCDAVVHAAASLSQDPYAAELSLTNGLGTQQAVELASRWEVQCLVFTSSLPVIGRPCQLPVTEAHPVDPPSAYHASKLYGEHLVALAVRGGLAAVNLRLSSPVGAGMARGRILSTFVARAMAGEPLMLAGRGSRGQDYVDVRDIARAVRLCIEQRALGLLNIASGRCVTNLELARCCVETLGSDAPVELSGRPDPEEGTRWEVSIEAAEREIGYRPKVRLRESILAVARSLEDPGG